MSNSGINFKAYYVDGENSEVKRFFVDHDTVTSFIFMEEKLKSIFPGLRNCDFKINWKDADGDLISISSDEDFITALTEMNYNPKVLYINANSKNSPEPRVFRVICDICEKGITGYRYKCIECPNYDLCSTCENNGNHSEHMVLRLPNSHTPFAKLDTKMMCNAARALKKSAFQAHRCAKEAFKTGKKEKARSEDAGTSTQHCPFTAPDMNEFVAQNINPFVEMLSKGNNTATSNNDQAGQNPLSDLIRSFIEILTGSVVTEPAAESNKTEQSTAAPTTPQKNQQEPSAPAAPPKSGQEMDWTIVSDNEDTSSQASSKTPTTQPPKPVQDPRLMRGLAQLHEMGFSNESNFLNYLLEQHDYKIDSVVKAILQLK
ncbi:sequestosome-1 isoform X2 [Harmonia axyridis]|uniref:sequestosome-1 isoform X2 n=1 Tax=Harmonia axyridis TaxID=115357 RepID=UPI001E277CB6|nr:sequestosome-1 isoform X2 [Harmonia axyridis]